MILAGQAGGLTTPLDCCLRSVRSSTSCAQRRSLTPVSSRACRSWADYGFFDGAGERAGLLDGRRSTIVRVHTTQNEVLQNAFASFVLYSLYKDMFRRGVQTEITHAIVFDEAHRAARLKLIPQFAKECRKFGLSLTLASQEAKDFQPALFSAVGNYLERRAIEVNRDSVSV